MQMNLIPGSMYGKHSTNLPVKQVEKYSNGERTTYYTWTLDSDGYPVKCEQKRTTVLMFFPTITSPLILGNKRKD